MSKPRKKWLVWHAVIAGTWILQYGDQTKAVFYSRDLARKVARLLNAQKEPPK